MSPGLPNNTRPPCHWLFCRALHKPNVHTYYKHGIMPLRVCAVISPALFVALRPSNTLLATIVLYLGTSLEQVWYHYLPDVSKETTYRINNLFHISNTARPSAIVPTVAIHSHSSGSFSDVNNLLFVTVSVGFVPTVTFFVFVFQRRLYQTNFFELTLFRYNPDRSTPLQYIPHSLNESMI